MNGHRRCDYPRCALRWLSVLVIAFAALAALPARAWAHGALNPEASVDEAHLAHVPPGLRVRVVDGDLRLWMSVPRRTRVTVLDYQGGDYLRFTPGGVYANESSPMFYLNLNPPVTPLLSLTRRTAPVWQRVSSGRSYVWRDGRVAALSESLSAPDAKVLGNWSIPLTVDGRAATITGTLDHRPRPSLAWLWPAAAVLLILPALLRLRDDSLERRMSRVIGAVTLAGVVILSLGAGLHGRPGLSPSLLAVMAVELALAAWAAWRLVRGAGEALTTAIIAVLAVYRTIAGISILWRGYTLLAVPTLAARIGAAVCLAGGICLGVGLVVGLDRTRPRGRAAAPGDPA